MLCIIKEYPQWCFYCLGVWGLKPGIELARPFQNQGRFQNAQINNLAISKRPMANGQGFKTAGNIAKIVMTYVWAKGNNSSK